MIDKSQTDLQQKIAELAVYKNNFQVLQSALEKSVKVIKTLENQLKSTEEQLSFSGKNIAKVIAELKTENARLKLSNDICFKRLINVEFELLGQIDKNKKLQSELNLALKKLQVSET